MLLTFINFNNSIILIYRKKFHNYIFQIFLYKIELHLTQVCLKFLHSSQQHNGIKHTKPKSPPEIKHNIRKKTIKNDLLMFQHLCLNLISNYHNKFMMVPLY